MAKSKGLTGSAAMQAAGYKPVLSHFKPDEKALIEKAAGLEGRSQANFVWFHALEAAKKVIAKSVSNI